MGKLVDMRPARWRAFFEAAVAVGEAGGIGDRAGRLAETVRAAKALGAPAMKLRDNQIYCSAQWTAEAWITSPAKLRGVLQLALLGLGRAGLALQGDDVPPPEAAAQAVQDEFDWQRRRDTGTD